MSDLTPGEEGEKAAREENELKEITSDEALEQGEKSLERKLTKDELRLKARIEKFFDANQGRDIVDVIGELVIKVEDLEKTLSTTKDDWGRSGREL